MEQTALLESQRQPEELGTHPVRFKTLDGHEYEGGLLIFAKFAPAETPCQYDGKTARDFLKGRTALPEKDDDINMREVSLDMFNQQQDDLPSRLPTHVLKIVAACADDDGLIDLSTGKKVVSDTVEVLDMYINNCLKGKELCNEHIIDSTVLNQLLVVI